MNSSRSSPIVLPLGGSGSSGKGVVANMWRISIGVLPPSPGGPLLAAGEGAVVVVIGSARARVFLYIFFLRQNKKDSDWGLGNYGV